MEIDFKEKKNKRPKVTITDVPVHNCTTDG